MKWGREKGRQISPTEGPWDRRTSVHILLGMTNWAQVWKNGWGPGAEEPNKDWSATRAQTFREYTAPAFRIHGQWRSRRTNTGVKLSQDGVKLLDTQRNPSPSLLLLLPSADSGWSPQLSTESGGHCCVPGPGLRKSSAVSESNHRRDLIKISALWLYAILIFS